VSLDQPERIRALREAFARHDVVLAEIGAWNNMLDPDPARRAASGETNAQALALADELGVLCCVNIAGSFHPSRWDSPHPDNLSEEAFELTVQNVQQIIDAVKPKRTFYSLETMPWVIPDSADIYLRLSEAIDRPMFGVHLDPVNLINCPARYYDNAELLHECFSKLGPWIVSCHGKDIIMRDQLTVHLDEVRPGLDAVGDSISMSFDPVAHDTLGLQILTEMIEASDEGFAWADRLANPWLENGAVLGLGTNDPDNMDLVEVSLR